MTGRRKIAPKYLSLENLREWWHDAYAPDSENVIIGHKLDDAATYLVVMDKYQVHKDDWNKVVKQSKEENGSIECRLKIFPLPPITKLDKVFLRV